jgi:hypothetical protein
LIENLKGTGEKTNALTLGERSLGQPMHRVGIEDTECCFDDTGLFNIVPPEGKQLPDFIEV